MACEADRSMEARVACEADQSMEARVAAELKKELQRLVRTIVDDEEDDFSVEASMRI